MAFLAFFSTDYFINQMQQTLQIDFSHFQDFFGATPTPAVFAVSATGYHRNNLTCITQVASHPVLQCSFCTYHPAPKKESPCPESITV
jgi:hypothetical protein